MWVSHIVGTREHGFAVLARTRTAKKKRAHWLLSRCRSRQPRRKQNRYERISAMRRTHERRIGTNESVRAPLHSLRAAVAHLPLHGELFIAHGSRPQMPISSLRLGQKSLARTRGRLSRTGQPRSFWSRAAASRDSHPLRATAMAHNSELFGLALMQNRGSRLLATTE